MNKEEKFIVLNDTFTPNYKMLKSMPLPVAKSYINGSIENCSCGVKSYIKETDEKVMCGWVRLEIKYNDKTIYPKIVENRTVCYNKITNKFSKYGATFGFCGYEINKLFEYLGIDWFGKMKDYPTYRNIPRFNLLTQTIVEKMIQGKITNPKDLIKNYLKISLKNKVLNWKIFRNALNKGVSVRVAHLCTYSNVPNETLKIITNLTDNFENREYRALLINTLGVCELLGKKLNYRWGVNRLTCEMDNLNKELKLLELNTKSHEKIEYCIDIPLLPNMKLIDNEYDLYEIGLNNNFATYWKSICRGDCLLVKYIEENTTYVATVLIRKKENRLYVLRVWNLRTNNQNNCQEIKKKLEEHFSQPFFTNMCDAIGVKNNEPKMILSPININVPNNDDFVIPF